jgi:HPt (histidine-containing phosphotransfer) domain-containing protein
MNDPPERSVDFDSLTAYVGGDRAIVGEVLSLFSDQAMLALKTLDPAMDSSAWRDAAHSLKGSALGICATRLGEACGEVEMARDAPFEVKRALLDKLRDALALTLTDIATYTTFGR